MPTKERFLYAHHIFARKIIVEETYF